MEKWVKALYSELEGSWLKPGLSHSDYDGASDAAPR